MSRRRYEILLPTRYNDGTSVEPEKLFRTQEELVAESGAVTASPEHLHGVWIHDGERFEDDHLRLVLDVEDSADHRAFFVAYKEQLKQRFQQIDIWIVSYEIDVL